MDKCSQLRSVLKSLNYENSVLQDKVLRLSKEVEVVTDERNMWMRRAIQLHKEQNINDLVTYIKPTNRIEKYL